ncbi:GD17905 [Drosophila simulans]|uniref:GD17905 n=1 Tax=Drosophila simulans TaxID=7240 RepID=B4QGM8_DROSI|nr:GD17905 [Drosophila simulans]
MVISMDRNKLVWNTSFPSLTVCPHKRIDELKVEEYILTKQRSCRFNYEAEEMMTVPIYSFGLCLSECRMFFALRVCGCVPHFYRNRWWSKVKVEIDNLLRN